ncbi:protein of unknown function DUF534 [Thermocrinis albus DSM 14484]|uniref:ABC transporter substrate binding protein n=1 Tax=Thermocrinis albus (strain DSM 14484 / JCM 11386 / HI 11/12) TaxID=638303 RepID=D3SPP5_THEAH|nr:ABC transporter substrate binding protein [Thermocrinis albus]ADC89132.1 protein of unknown function DUF534 [Thermocrinis albus DSM 14484]
MKGVVFLLLTLIPWIFSCTGDDTPYIAFFISGEGRQSKVEGFKQAMKDMGVSIKYDLYDGQNNLRKIEEIAQQIALQENRYRLVAVGGSLEAYYLKKAKPNFSKPIVIMGGTAVKVWGLTQDFGKPTNGVTGVDNQNAELMEKRLEIFKKFFPHVKKAVVFCTPKFEASRYATRLTVKAGEKIGIKVVPVSVRDLRDLEYVMANMKKDGFSAVIITPCFYTENFLTTYILQLANFYQIPVMCLSPDQAARGCPVAYGSSGFEQGYQAAHIALRLLRGDPVESVPFEKVRTVHLAVNMRALRELGYTYDRKALDFADIVYR